MTVPCKASKVTPNIIAFVPPFRFANVNTVTTDTEWGATTRAFMNTIIIRVIEPRSAMEQCPVEPISWIIISCDRMSTLKEGFYAWTAIVRKM